MNAISWIHKYKRPIFISILLLLSVYIAFTSFRVYQMMLNPAPSIILDKEQEVILNNQSNYVKWGELPPLAKRYVTFSATEVPLSDTIFPHDPFKRKLADFFIQHFLKEEVVSELYPNHLYFGNGLIGINNASDYYFSKDINELSELEILFLFSKTKNNKLTSSKNLELFIKEVHSAGLISNNQFNQLTTDIPLLMKKIYNSNTVNHSYIQYVVSEIEEELETSQEDFFRKGYTVYTSLEPNVQKTLSDKIRNTDVFSESQMDSVIESGMVVLNHTNGSISGLVGGRDFLDSSINRAYQLQRQPASTFKPLIAYGPAIDLGWTPEDKLKDVPMKFGSFRPRNYDYKYRKSVRLRDALRESYNVPSAWLLHTIGFEKGLSYIQKFNLFQIDKNDDMALSLGFNKIGTSPLSMAKAYTIFSNDGKMAPANSVRKVQSNYGFTVFNGDTSQKKIIESRTAAVMRSLLIDVVEEGTGENAQIKEAEVGGKTGTTSYDAWFVGFSGDYTGAVWMGPDLIHPKNKMDIGGGDSPSLLFGKVFSEIQSH